MSCCSAVRGSHIDLHSPHHSFLMPSVHESHVHERWEKAKESVKKHKWAYGGGTIAIVLAIIVLVLLVHSHHHK